MESTTIGRSYAEGVYGLAEKHKLQDEFVENFAALDVVLDDATVRTFLESPRIDKELKKRVLSTALTGRVNPLFLNFVLLVLDKRRQRLYRAIANEYRGLIDKAAGRLHVQVTLARAPSEETAEEIRNRLSTIFGKSVIPHVTVDEKLLGGIIVRSGDQVIDGSLRRRLLALRRQLISAT